LLLLTVQVLSRRFMRAATAIGSMGGTRTRRTSARPLRFRDPLLLMQLLQQSIYLVPLCLLLWRQTVGRSGGAPWFWLVLIFMCGTLATALAWITVAAEDAPELLTAAPLARALVVRAKIEAALLPVALGLCAFGCSVSNALLQIYKPPGTRDSFKIRGRSSPVKAFIEMGVILAWMLVCALLTWIGLLIQR
jgi:hypothetical protein